MRVMRLEREVRLADEGATDATDATEKPIATRQPMVEEATATTIGRRPPTRPLRAYPKTSAA